MQVNAVLLLLIVTPSAALLRGTGDQTLTTDMRPDVVRKLLNSVEQKWVHTRAMVMSNATDKEEAFADMEKSCVKVATAIVAGSEGQKDRVNEYMQDVCTVDTAHKSSHDEYDLCSGFASGIEAEMTDDSEYNRDGLQLSQFCRKFWDNSVNNAAQAEVKERVEEEEKERQEEAEAEKKAAALRTEEAEKARKEKEEAEKKAAAVATEEAEEAEKVKAYEAEEAAKAASNAFVNGTSASVNATSASQVNATATAVVAPQASQANSTMGEANGTVEQTSSSATAPATLANSTPAVVVAAPENKTDSASTAKTVVKNATAAMKK